MAAGPMPLFLRPVRRRVRFLGVPLWWTWRIEWVSLEGRTL